MALKKYLYYSKLSIIRAKLWKNSRKVEADNMNQVHESIVKVNLSPTSVLMKKSALIVVTVAAFLMTLIIPYFIIAGFAMLAVCYFAFRSMDYEYEYLLVEDELTITKIIAKAKRKKVRTISLSTITEFIPYELYKPRKEAYNGAKTIDYSSRTNTAGTYAATIREQGKIETVFMEMPDEMASSIKRYMQGHR